MEPCHATLRDNVPSGDRWIHEIKYDGYRVQGHKSRERVILYTRNGYDWTDRFGPIASSIAKLPVNQAIFDGEIISADKNGAPDFAALQEDLARGCGNRLVYYIFDLLYLDGFDIRAAPLVERKRLLGELLSETGRGPILFGEHIDGNGHKMFENACAMGLEGIVSKQRDAPYRSGRSESWIKVKCTKTGDYPIIAFVEKLGASPRRVASLYIGRRENGRLLYAGKARSGYTETSARRLRELLDPHIRKTSPLDVSVKKPKATWVEPVVDAEIEYSTITGDGLLREAVYRGVRDDLERAPPKVSSEQRKQTTTKRKEAGKPHIGVPHDNILQLLPDAVAPSKEELGAYWGRVGKRALEYLGRRPLKLVRHTHHTIF
jgi:bifunctional non-homologous end joining protein LigD